MSIFKNRIFIGCLCIAFAILIAFVAFPYINNLTTSTVKVVAATQDIPAGTKLSSDMIKIVEVGKFNLPENIVYEEQLAQLAGKFASVDIRAGDFFLTSKVETAIISPESKIRAMGSNEMAYTMDIGGAALMTFLPNDILTVYRINAEGEAEVVPELTYISVVCETTSNGTQILYASQTKLSPKTITFILDERQIKVLLELQNKKNFKFLLTYRGNDSNKINNYINIQKQILNNLANK